MTETVTIKEETLDNVVEELDTVRKMRAGAPKASVDHMSLNGLKEELVDPLYKDYDDESKTVEVPREELMDVLGEFEEVIDTCANRRKVLEDTPIEALQGSISDLAA